MLNIKFYIFLINKKCSTEKEKRILTWKCMHKCMAWFLPQFQVLLCFIDSKDLINIIENHVLDFQGLSSPSHVETYHVHTLLRERNVILHDPIQIRKDSRKLNKRKEIGEWVICVLFYEILPKIW